MWGQGRRALDPTSFQVSSLSGVRTVIWSCDGYLGICHLTLVIQSFINVYIFKSVEMHCFIFYPQPLKHIAKFPYFKVQAKAEK